MQSRLAGKPRLAMRIANQNEVLGRQAEALAQMPSQMELGGEEASGEMLAGKAQGTHPLLGLQPVEHGLQGPHVRRIEAIQ